MKKVSINGKDYECHSNMTADFIEIEIPYEKTIMKAESVKFNNQEYDNVTLNNVADRNEVILIKIGVKNDEPRAKTGSTVKGK
tara:strand:- start:53 stop:301 length:249 start_codon:yes stop_codon:yes gene_type:complete